MKIIVVGIDKIRIGINISAAVDGTVTTIKSVAVDTVFDVTVTKNWIRGLIVNIHFIAISIRGIAPQNTVINRRIGVNGNSIENLYSATVCSVVIT